MRRKKVRMSDLKQGQCLRRNGGRVVWQKDSNVGCYCQQINGKDAGRFQDLDFDELVTPVEVTITVK